MPASKQLFILRHAKSSWEEPGIDDHDRPLASRGRRAATVLAEHLRESGIRPELVLCSSARRTRETFAGLELDVECEVEPELYDASPADVLARLRHVGEELRSVMVIGHNPAMHVLVLRLCTKAAGDAGEALIDEVQRKFPTGAMATLSFDCEWSELGADRAILSAFVKPKQLPGGRQ